jgi:hypothetical protein
MTYRASRLRAGLPVLPTLLLAVAGCGASQAPARSGDRARVAAPERPSAVGAGTKGSPMSSARCASHGFLAPIAQTPRIGSDLTVADMSCADAYAALDHYREALGQRGWNGVRCSEHTEGQVTMAFGCTTNGGGKISGWYVY